MSAVTASAPSAAPAAAAPSGGGGATVLSDKVSRALHVRTDTPAMRAALAALAGLGGDDKGGAPSTTTTPATTSTAAAAGGSNSTGGTIDARSVRAAIEEDALRRALEFQSELRRLAGDASLLRERVGRVAGAAGAVRRRAEGRILEAHEEGKGGEEGGGDNGFGGGAAGDAGEAERALASRLARAQQSKVEAAKRQTAVDAFLDKFDLGAEEARLLDHYHFEGFWAGDVFGGEDGAPWSRPTAALRVAANPSEAAMAEAHAFLDALERLAVIRRELTRAFGSGAEGEGGSAGEEGADASFMDDDLEGADAASGPPEGGKLGAPSAWRMVERLASRQERAHERLYQFVQCFLGIGAARPAASANAPTSSRDAGRPNGGSNSALGRFRDGDEADEAYNHPLIRRSLRALRHSPARRAHLLELVASGRRAEVTRRFLLALTSGYGGAAPLEMGAHDPVGYAGDMLAFGFRAFRVEGELVRTLFEWKDGGDEEGGRAGEAGTPAEEGAVEEGADEDSDGEDDEAMDVAATLAQSMGGLARPLNTRLAQVVRSLAARPGGDGETMSSGPDRNRGDFVARAAEDDADGAALDRLVALFAVAGLLRFYGAAVAKALDKLGGGVDGAASDTTTAEPNPFGATCDECLTEAAAAYAASLRGYGAMLAAHARRAGASEATLAQRAIVRLAEARAASPGFAEDLGKRSSQGGKEGGEEDAASRQLALPLLVRTMVEAAVPYLRTLDDCAALKAALGAAVKSGLDANDAAPWEALVRERETAVVEALVDAEADEVLGVCGLAGLRSALRHFGATADSAATMAMHPGLSAKTVEAATKTFYASLYAPPIPTFEESIEDPEVRKAARSRTAERVADAYEELYEAVAGERGGYRDLSFLGHTPAQVRTLLSM